MFQLNHIFYYIFKLPVSDSGPNLLIRHHGKHVDSLNHCNILWSEDINSELSVPLSRSEASFILSKKVVEELKAILGPRDQKAACTFQVSFNRELIVTCEPMSIYWSSSFGMVWQQQLANNCWWNRNVTWTRNTVPLLPQWLQLHRSILRTHQPSATIVNWQTWKHLASHHQ